MTHKGDASTKGRTPYDAQKTCLYRRGDRDRRRVDYGSGACSGWRGRSRWGWRVSVAVTVAVASVAVASVQHTLVASAASGAWAAPGSEPALLAGPASPVDRPSSVDQALPDRRLLVDRPLSGGRSSTIAHSLRTV